MNVEDDDDVVVDGFLFSITYINLKYIVNIKDIRIYNFIRLCILTLIL